MVVPNYTLAPQASIPQITLQVARAVAWAWRHADALNADARRLTVIGQQFGDADHHLERFAALDR